MVQHPALALVTGATRLVGDAGEVSLLGLSGPEVQLLIEGRLSLISRLRGQLAESVDQALAVDRPGDVGAPNAASWVRGRFGLSPGSAGRLVRETADLGAAPVAAHAARVGAIPVESAVAIGHAVSGLPPEVDLELRAEGERVLLGFAVGEDGPALDAQQLRYVGRHLHEVLDPELADQLLADRLDREEAATYRRRFLSLVDDGMGGVRIRGLVTTEAGAILAAVLDPLAAPAPAQPVDRDLDETADRAPDRAVHRSSAPVSLMRAQPTQDSVPGGPSPEARGGNTGPGADQPESAAEEWLPDQRTPEQRLADALVEAGQRLLAGGTLPAGGGDRPQLIVTIDHDRLAAGLGSGSLVNGEELAPAVVRRLACDAAMIPAVLGSASQPLDLGRSVRTASPAQRRALALRDGGCAFPGCDRPPGWCEAHHLQRWENLGPTDLENLVLVCGFHHRLIHREHWEIRPPKDGIRPLFIQPPGSTASSDPAATTSTTPTTSSGHRRDQRGCQGGRVLVIGAWLERWLLAAVIVVTVGAVAVPGPGRWIDRHSGVNLVLVVLVLASALGIPSGAARALRRLAPRLALVVVIATVTLPVLADALAHVLGSGPLREGVLAVGVAPAEVASIGLSGLAGGDVAVAAALLAASTLVSVAVAGPILSVLAGAGVSGGHVVVQLALVVGLPLVVGLLARPALSARSATAAGQDRATDDRSDADDVALDDTTAATLSVVSTVAVLVLVALVAVQVQVIAAYLTVTAVLVALIAVSAVGGALLGRLVPAAAARSTLLHVSMRDFAIASGIAAAAFGARATGPLGIYGVLVIAWGTLVATWSARRACAALSRT